MATALDWQLELGVVLISEVHGREQVPFHAQLGWQCMQTENHKSPLPDASEKRTVPDRYLL